MGRSQILPLYRCSHIARQNWHTFPVQCLWCVHKACHEIVTGLAEHCKTLDACCEYRRFFCVSISKECSIIVSEWDEESLQVDLNCCKHVFVNAVGRRESCIHGGPIWLDVTVLDVAFLLQFCLLLDWVYSNDTFAVEPKSCHKHK